MRGRFFCAAALLLAGCNADPGASAAESTPAYVSAPVYNTIHWGSDSNILIGVAIVERATGTVSFCKSECIPIGKIGPAADGSIAIHASGDMHFWVVNSATGPAAFCTVEQDNGYWSGNCQSPAALATREAAVAEGKDEKAALNAEANAQAAAFWEKAVSKCGDSYVWKYQQYRVPYGKLQSFAEVQFKEFRKVSFVVSPRKLTEADQLNGIEWAGQFQLLAKASRGGGKNWEPWSNGGHLDLTVQKIGGKWVFSEASDGRYSIPVTFEKPSCDILKDK